MARKREELTTKQRAALIDFMMRGIALDEIVRSGKLDLSRATIARRMKDLRPVVNEKRAKRPIPDPTKVPAKRASSPHPTRQAAAVGDEGDADEDDETPALPEDEITIAAADNATLDRWIRTADRVGRQAEKTGNLRALGESGRLLAQLLEAKRKRTPPAPDDPDDDPDMIALGELVAKKFHEYIDKLDRLESAGAIQ